MRLAINISVVLLTLSSKRRTELQMATSLSLRNAVTLVRVVTNPDSNQTGLTQVGNNRLSRKKPYMLANTTWETVIVMLSRFYSPFKSKCIFFIARL